MRHPTLKAPRLCRGDTVGIVSPSYGIAGMVPHRVERGASQLEALGYKVKLGAHALETQGYVSGTPEQRASDLHDMFRDPAVHAVLSSIGGDHSCQLLPLLDFDLIRQNPKVFIGYSDITVLNVAIWQATGLVTFNGPTLLTDFAEYPEMPEYTRGNFLKAVTIAAPIGELAPAAAWTEEFLDWLTKEDLTRPRALTRSEGWTWLKHGSAEGVLIGGCLESLQHLRGTRYWPEWDGAILFFETSEEKPSPAKVDGILMDYENMGVLDKVHGLLVGRPKDYSVEEKQQLRDVILERTRRYRFPVVTDMDFGHTAPQLTLPIGCRARIDTAARKLEILEPGVL